MSKKQAVLLVIVCSTILITGVFLLRRQLSDPNSVRQRQMTENLQSTDPERLAKYEQQLSEAEEKVKAEPSSYHAWIDMAVVSEALGDYRTAESSYRKAIGTNQKGGFVAWGNLANLYKRQERWTEAIETYRSAIQAIPQEVEFYYNLAEIQADGKGGTRQDALETLERGILTTGAEQLKAAKERLQKDGRL